MLPVNAQVSGAIHLRIVAFEGYYRFFFHVIAKISLREVVIQSY